MLTLDSYLNSEARSYGGLQLENTLTISETSVSYRYTCNFIALLFGYFRKCS